MGLIMMVISAQHATIPNVSVCQGTCGVFKYAPFAASLFPASDLPACFTFALTCRKPLLDPNLAAADTE